jgi:YD repeat-containing protein
MTPTFSADPTDQEITRARVFADPLVPSGRATLPEENRALAAVITRYHAGKRAEALLPFWDFLKKFPDSPWQASLLVNLGQTYRHTGYFTRALETWESAWSLAKSRTDPSGRSMGDRAVGNLLELNARLGRFERLEALFAQIEDRPISGPATEQVTGARDGLWMMRNRPDQAFRCGPLAIDSILAATREGYIRDQRIFESKSTPQGTSLVQMRKLAGELGLPMQMAHRDPGAPIIAPALVHWRAGHFAALVREENERLLIRDPTFGNEIWISRVALDDEATGFVLVAVQDLPQGWRPVGEAEGETVWGKGLTDGNNPDNNGDDDPQSGDNSNGDGGDPDDPDGGDPNGGDPNGDGSGNADDNGPSGGDGPGCGMATYSAHLMLVSLRLRDTPLRYTPPRGPKVAFTVTYSQREAFQPQVFFYSNLGPKWTFGWLSYLEDDPTNASDVVRLTASGGGHQTFSGLSGTAQTSAPEFETQAVLVRTSTSPIRYERRLSSGAIDVFEQSDGSGVWPRRIFMTERRDPAGNAVTFTYDAQLRLIAATDALGQVTTLDYNNPQDVLKITGVTDPFGRHTTLQYDAQGRLSSVTDVIGLTSTFSYDGGDIITTLATPYGVSRFTSGETGRDRWLELVDAVGGRERVEYRVESPIADSEPVNQVPTVSGVTFANVSLHYRNTFYWTKRAMSLAPRNPIALA